MEKVQPRTGDRVRARQHTWVVREVDSFERCRVLSLEPTDEARASACTLIQPFDDVSTVSVRMRPARVGVRTWRRACRSLLGQTGDAASLRTAASARVDLLPYQLEPALAVLQGLGTRLLLADDVGLGKTVQAMLAFAELLHRGVAARVLVLCPAGLRTQWADECARRFGYRLAAFDQRAIRQLRARLPVGVNPWSTEPLAVASIDYVKRPEILPLVLEAGWDVVVVDEAHGASGDSDRCEAVTRLTEQAPYVFLLTATPHSGEEATFNTLCRFGQHSDSLVVFKRTRLETGRDRGRRVHTLRVRASDAERRVHAALQAITRAIRREQAQPGRHIWLMLALFHKRALSCPFALAASVERRLQLLGDGTDARGTQLMLPLEDPTGELDTADTAPMWSAPALHDTAVERRLLERLAHAARLAQHQSSKLQRLRRLLRRIGEPVIVFTEYRDTLLHLREQVVPGAVMIHGGMTLEQRRAALAAFPATGRLLATDAAGEGLNLQHHCRTIVNLELPWNPMRLEQRIGRVDRIGQSRRVHVFHLLSSGTGEADLLERLSTRVSRAHERVGAANPMCGRPAWTEEASARLVVMREETPASPTEVGAGTTVPLTRLVAEAAREATRLGIIRSTLQCDASPQTRASAGPVERPLMARTRHRRSRLAMNGRLLAVVDQALHDSTGRRVASRILPMLCASGPWSPESLVRAATALLNEPPHVEWLDGCVHLHDRMTQLRLQRAQSIAELLTVAASQCQPGLFDRRIEHEQSRLDSRRTAMMAVADERVARAQAALSLRLGTPILRLVLTAGPTELSK